MSASPVWMGDRARLEAARRVIDRFVLEPELAQLVVYRSPSGRVTSREFRGQDVGQALIGVYTRGVTLGQLQEDLR